MRCASGVRSSWEGQSRSCCTSGSPATGLDRRVLGNGLLGLVTGEREEDVVEGRLPNRQRDRFEVRVIKSPYDLEHDPRAVVDLEFHQRRGGADITQPNTCELGLRALGGRWAGEPDLPDRLAQP